MIRFSNCGDFPEWQEILSLELTTRSCSNQTTKLHKIARMIILWIMHLNITLCNECKTKVLTRLRECKGLSAFLHAIKLCFLASNMFLKGCPLEAKTAPKNCY